MKIIAVACQKGGTGKTTTALALASVLVENGRRVLLVDMDPQASLTQALGLDVPGQSLAEVIGGAEPGHLFLQNIIKTVSTGLDLAPSDIALANVELALVGRLGRELALKNVLAQVKDNYDAVIIDCPPSLGLLTVCGLVAAQGLIIPTLPAAQDLRGLRMFLDTVSKVRELNRDLKLIGIVISQFDSRLTSHNQAVIALRSGGLPVIMPPVPRSVRVQEASGVNLSLITYDPKGKPAEAYRQITSEVIKWLDQNRT